MPPPPPAATVADMGSQPINRRSELTLFSRTRLEKASPAAFWKKAFAFFGPGYLVAVGYMDPGNWATGIAAGSAFGYDLLFVVLLSNLMAMLLQALAAKLGIVTGLDLAQACRERYSPPVRIALWLLCEVAIVACDLAEVIGTAIALKLLFGLPLIGGILLTTLDVFLILALQARGFRKLEAFVIALIAIIAVCFAAELVLAQPDIAAVGKGFLPQAAIAADPAMLYLAIGIIGATVMPHNLYLHSSLVKNRGADGSVAGKRNAVRFATLDSSIALGLAFLINAAIVMLAAASFHAHGRNDVTGIQDAYRLLSPMLGAGLASTVFAVALLASGQNATVTGTMAGQIVLEGFTDLRMPVWARRLVSRLLAVVPAAIVAILYGEGGTTRLLILSQIVLSLQLPFAVIPLLRITGDPRKMGMFANRAPISLAAWLIAAALIALNGKLILDTLHVTALLADYDLSRLGR